MPIILTFSRPVRHRSAVERSIQLWTSKPVTGAWYWDTSTSLVFRPRTYWPEDTRVHFVAHFAGLEASPGVYGTADLAQSFRIGSSLIAGRVGRRVDRVVPELEAAAAGQRDPPGRAGRPGWQHVRRPRRAPAGDRPAAAGDVAPAQQPGRIGQLAKRQPLRIGPGVIHTKFHAGGHSLAEHALRGGLEFTAEQAGGAGGLESQ
jgi:Big-like domain-containing protein